MAEWYCTSLLSTPGSGRIHVLGRETPVAGDKTNGKANQVNPGQAGQFMAAEGAGRLEPGNRDGRCLPRRPAQTEVEKNDMSRT